MMQVQLPHPKYQGHHRVQREAQPGRQQIAVYTHFFGLQARGELSLVRDPRSGGVQQALLRHSIQILLLHPL